MKLLKALLIVFALIAIGLFTTCAVLSKDMPTGVEGEKASQLAEKMLIALNKPAWDTTQYLKWTFRGNHHYIWDKKNNLAEISWKDKRVLLNLDQVDGLAYSNGVLQEGDDSANLIAKAWSFWCNDSFWFCAPYKIQDPGTSLSYIAHEKGDGLMVTYSSGGVTPGDSYLWILDETGKPIGYEMYVKILPVKGIYTSWESWVEIETGALLSSKHGNGKLSVDIDNIAGGQTLESVGLTENLFEVL